MLDDLPPATLAEALRLWRVSSSMGTCTDVAGKWERHFLPHAGTMRSLTF